MIHRDPDSAAGTAYDLIIVGGGVYGITLTLQAARRGLKPLLLEAADFGGATSWNSLRIVHGGLRYLQRADWAGFRESVRERSWWLREFPDLVFPLRCLMPLYGVGLRRPAILRAALSVNDFLSRARNEGLAADRRLPDGELLSPTEARALLPGMTRGGLRGAAAWYDGFMPDSQRLLIEVLHWATACGAVALNYVRARELLQRGAIVTGVEAEDLESGRRLKFSAPVVFNCGGPWCREIAQSFHRDVPELLHLSLALNLLLDHEPIGDAALAVSPPGRDGRTYFLVPWKGKILAGTFHTPWAAHREEAKVETLPVQESLADLRAAAPALDVTPRDILRVQWGFLPARRAGTDRLATHAVIYDHGRSGGPRGLVSVSGVKFTTARRVAELTLERAGGYLAATPAPAGLVERPAPSSWYPRDHFEELIRIDPARAADHVRRLSAEEAVLHLDDLLLRRTDWGSSPRSAMQIGPQVAELLGWDSETTAGELNRLEHPPV